MIRLSDSAKKKLENAYGMDNTHFEWMEKNSTTLVKMINSYPGKFIRDDSYSGASYKHDKSNPESSEIRIGYDYFKKDNSGGTLQIKTNADDLNFWSALAHELGHATGVHQNRTFPSNAQDYSNARMQGEGEAIYYEELVLSELNLPSRYQHYIPQLFADMRDANGTIQPLTPSLIDKIGSYNGKMIPSGQDPNQPKLNYDESNKAYFLYWTTDINKEYLEATGNNLYNTTNQNINGKAVLDINFPYANTQHIKSMISNELVNVKDDYNMVIDDKIIAPQINAGSPNNNFIHSQQYLLYGGKGNDTLYGNSSDDILIGGSDNDHLYGNAGKDILSGSAGRDVMHGGDGFDTYRADREDTIKDSDGLGEVYLDGARLEGGVRANDRQQKYISADGKTTYELESDGTLKVNGDKQGKGLTIQDFKNGDLGIDLKEQEAPVQKSSQSPVSSLSHLATMVLNGSREDRDEMGRQIASSPLGEQFRQRGEELQQAHREEQLALQQQQMQEAREQQEAQVRRGPVMH